MNLYTLDENFRRKDTIDEFSSAIWTERYSSPGDVTLVVDSTPAMMELLSEGTRLGMDGTNEVMLLDTQSIEGGLLKVEGESLLGFLKERPFGSVIDMQARSWFSANYPPENIITHIVLFYVVVVDPTGDPYLHNGAMPSGWAGGVLNRIPALGIDPIVNPHPNINHSVPHGQVYETIKQIADTFSLGIKLYLLFSEPYGNYELRFKVYRGVDRSATVQFSPALDNLKNVKELRSTKGYRTVAYAHPNDEHIGYFGVAYVPGTEEFIGFDRRALLVFVDDVYLEKIAASGDWMTATIEDHNNTLSVLEQRAKDALANNNYTKVVDGEVIPQFGYTFGEDYDLGDIVSLRGYSDIIQTARITEYIRSQDSTGEREYPTVSIID